MGECRIVSQHCSPPVVVRGQKEEAIQCIFKSASDSDFQRERRDLQCIRRNVVQRQPGGK